MKIKLIAAGVLAGGIAVAGLTGSAYAASDTPKTKTGGTAGPTGIVAGTAKEHGAIAIACAGKGVRINGKPGKAISIKAPGKLPATPEKGGPVFRTGGKALPAPPAGAKVTRLLATKGKGIVRIGPAPKGLRCVEVKPATPGAPPPVPAR